MEYGRSIFVKEALIDQVVLIHVCAFSCPAVLLWWHTYNDAGVQKRACTKLHTEAPIWWQHCRIHRELFHAAIWEKILAYSRCSDIREGGGLGEPHFLVHVEVIWCCVFSHSLPWVQAQAAFDEVRQQKGTQEYILGKFTYADIVMAVAVYATFPPERHHR